MAKKYLEELSKIMDNSTSNSKIEIKHFFSGAAVYANKKICITLTPKGLALKLPEKQMKQLLDEKIGKKLRYFPGAPIKKEYAVLPKNKLEDSKLIKKLVNSSIKYAVKSK